MSFYDTKHNCRLPNIAMCDYQESVTTGQTDRLTDGQTDAGQSNPYMPLCFAGDTNIVSEFQEMHVSPAKHTSSCV